MRITTSDLVRAINDLPRDRVYRYVNPRTPTSLIIRDITLPEGPIIIGRFNPNRGEGPANIRDESISTEMLARIAYAYRPNRPINFDRVLGASYNTRSALEALLAHTPQFYYCYPGRLDSYSGRVERGHKHLMWCPDNPHAIGVIQEIDTDIVITEMPVVDLAYEGIAVPEELIQDEIDINIQRQHARIQVALVLIGIKLGFNCWVARNDQSIIYNNQRIGEMDGVIQQLDNQSLLSISNSAVRAALLIDCIWFGNSRYMPAVMEIEHTTGVISGLNRMLGLLNQIPSIRTRYVIVAPDEERQLVVREINRPQFRPLEARYFPYSAVNELYLLCDRRNLQGVTQDFIDSFLEQVIS